MSKKFSRRKFLIGAGAGAAITLSGTTALIGATNVSQISKRAGKKESTRNEAMKSFTKAMWVYLDRSFPNKKDDIPAILDKWADAGFKLLIPEIRKGDGKIHYGKTKYPVTDYAKGWDPLEVFNNEAKKRGIKVHPWCHVFRGASSDFAKKYPELIGLNKKGENEGDFLCPARDEVHNWAFSYYEELMNNYDIAGVHLDYIRYRGGLCWCNYCKSVFKRETGINMEDMVEGSPEWARWVTSRIHNIERFVKRLQDDTIKRDLETSAAVYAAYPSCVVEIGQDWLTWAYEKWVDYILPMNYWGNDEKFKKYAEIHIGGPNKSIPMFEGFGIRLPGKPFEVNLDGEGVFNRSNLIKNMGFQGVCYFSSSSIKDVELSFIKKL